ncbi:hypothetical protein BDB01DRAFT_718047 [Pilobolus umbonatus]|nr:hypothetical protein BDB01DRAFT_718047 [Pilobolus umbonatus]
MLESLVSSLLNKVLGAYVSNLNYNQLKIGIWSGYLGELVLTIPWNNLRGKPVIVHIKDVYILAVPRNETNMTAEEIAEREYDAKMRKLENAELTQTEHTNPTEDAKNDTFSNQLLTRILNNLQFSISNIHIRYEDDISTNHRFAAGLTLSELSAITTNDQWEPDTISEAVSTVHKLAVLESLSVYWDTLTPTLSQDASYETFKQLIATTHHIPSEHQYILKPVSGTGRVQLHKNFGNETPKIDASLLFDELSFSVDNEQYRDTILMIDLFHSYLKKEKYKHLHPPADVTPTTDPLVYFRFAANAVLSEIHEKNERWTWRRIKKRRENRIEYIQCYVQHKLDRATPEELEQLHHLERDLSYEDLRFYRSLAKPKLRNEKARLAAIEKKRKAEAEANKNKKGWGISNWWYGASADPNDTEVIDDIVITDEQMKEFYDVIDYNDDKAAIAASVDLPKDTIMLSLRTALKKGSFTVRKDPHDDTVELLSLVFDNVSMGLTQYVESFKAMAALGDLCLYDSSRPHSPYYKLMGAKDKAVDDKKESAIDDSNQINTLDDHFFTVTYEHKPLDGRADNAICLFMRNIDIVYNPIVIREVINFFTPPETSADSINALIEMAGNTLEDIKKQTRASLEFALDQHTTLDLKVDMDAPVIIIPEDCLSKSSRGIVLDAGHINVESNLAPVDAVNQLKSKSATDLTNEDNITLRKLMYDKFTVQLTQTKILVGDSIITCLMQVRTPRPELNYLHLVDRIDMTFLLELCIIRKSTEMPRFKVSGHLPLLKVNFSDTKYRAIMKLPYLIDASGILGNKDTTAPHYEQSGSAMNEEKWLKLMNNKVWGQDMDEIYYDSDSDLDDQSRDNSSIFSANETADTDISNYSSQATSKRNSQSRTATEKKEVSIVEEKMFQLDFKVDRVLANILEGQKSSEGDNSSEVLLCDVDLQHLNLNYSMRPFDMSVNLSLQSLDVTDRMTHGSEFKYLITSNQDMIQPGSNKEAAPMKNLVNIDYVRCDKTSPEYVEKHESIDQTVYITLSTLNFIVTRSSVLKLHDFILHTFVDDEVINTATDQEYHPSSTLIPSNTNEESEKEQPIYNSMRVRLMLDSVNFILNNDGTRLATGELSLGDLSTIMSEGQTNVAAKFANFTLTHNLDLPIQSSMSRPPSNQLLTIQGEELIDLKYNSFINDGRKDYPGYDHALFLRMGSAQFNFLEQPVHQLMDFLSKFAEMKSTYDIAREAAMESAQQLGQAATKMHFDIVIKTPVVFFPELHQNTMDVVIAHLGEIWACNKFVEEEGSINTITAGLRAINLTSNFYFARPQSDSNGVGITGKTRSPQLQTLSIVDDIDLNLDIKIPQKTLPNRPDIDISGSIEDVSMKLTGRQYIFLMDIINIFSRVFSGSPEQSSSEPRAESTSVAVTKSNKSNEDYAEMDNTDMTPRMKVSLIAKSIGLEVFMHTDKDLQTPPSLSRIALNNSNLLFHMYPNDTMDVNMTVTSLTVDDTRPDVNSKFKRVMPEIKSGHQFELHIDLKEPNPNRSGLVMMTVKDPKVILSLDHAFLLLEFFTLPFNGNVPASVETDVNQPAAEQGMELSYLLSINNAEFILLANADCADSEAVVLSAQELMITQQTKTAIVVKQAGLFLCKMDMLQKSTLRVIQPFDVNLSMNSNPKNEQGGTLTDLVINIDPLVLRLSYRDAILVTDIFNKAYDLYTKSTGVKGVASSNTDYTQTITQSIVQTSRSLEEELESMRATNFAQESLRLSFRGAQIVLIEELHETPMIDMNLKPFNVEVSNWSKDLSVAVEFSTFINYFNIKNSHWEPLLEPWNFQLELTRNPSEAAEPLKARLFSDSILNLNVTHTFVESALATLSSLDKRRNTIYSGERGTVAPYEIRNRTGYDVVIWNNNMSSEGPVLKSLKNNASLSWWFEDWKTRRETTTVTSNIINVQIEGALWESLRNIKVDTEGEHMHTLRPAINNVQHHIVFDVKLVDKIKIVTLRSSLVIENRTLLSVDLASITPMGKMDGRVQKIAPGDDYAIPIKMAYSNRFCIRPDAGFGYRWTEKALQWKDFVNVDNIEKNFACLSQGETNMPPFIFQINARQDIHSPLFGYYPAMNVRLSAPIEIENLLPFDFNFRIIDKTTGEEFKSYLRKGGLIPIHVIENNHLVLFNIQLADTPYLKSEYAILSTRRIDDLDIDDSIELVNGKTLTRLTIRISRFEIPESGGAIRYSIYSPYIIINKSGLPISFKQKLKWTEALYTSNDDISLSVPGPKLEPLMYSYPDIDNHNRSLIKVGNSEWSQPLSFEAIGSAYDVLLANKNKTEEFHLGIHIQEGEGKFKLTRVITISPRFVLSNQTGEVIQYRVPETKHDQRLETKKRIALYNMRMLNEQQLTIKLEGYSNTWSAPFNINDIGNVYIRLSNDFGKQDTLIRVAILLQDATIFIVLTKELDDNWPYLLVNKTDEDMSFYQEDPNTLRDDYNAIPARNARMRRYQLPAHQSIPYSWDMPAIKEKNVILNINGRERPINLQEIGSLLPFRHATREGLTAITSIDVKIHGSRRVLELTPFSQNKGHFKLLDDANSMKRISSSSSSVSSSSTDLVTHEGFGAAEVDLSLNAIFQVQLKELGISIIGKQSQELAYMTLRGIDLTLKDSTLYHSLRWNIDWIQIDNQLYGSLFPILLYPTNLTTNGDKRRTEIIPTVQMGLDRVKDDSHGVVYFKYFSILMQEISVELEESFTISMLDFLNFDSLKTTDESSVSSKIWDYTTDIPDIKPIDDVAQIYFEIFNIQPIRFDLSFVKSDSADHVDRSSTSPLSYLINAFTMTIGNINSAPLRFNALAIENVMASGNDLANKVTIHYKDQLVYQLHRILGSADFLGNPVGLFSNLSSGVAELFYEPYQGLIMSDRPQDLGYGIAKGFSGFIKKSVYGVTDSFTKITGSIGKGLSAATMDKEYQDRRRMTLARNRPKHALFGVAQGANSLANSVASGFAGLVTQPMEGASKNGVGGFFKGVGKGFVGVVTKPVVGVFDFTSNVTEGIRNTTTDGTNMIERVRYPRYIGSDNILKPYSLREAIGQHWLKDVDGGKYSQDAYIAHCHVQNDERVAMLTSNRVMLIRTRKLSVEWQEPFTEIQTIKREPTGIAIYLRSMSREPFLIISDKYSREQFFKKIEEAVTKYNSSRRVNDD